MKEKIKNIFSDFRTGVIVLVLTLIFSTTSRAFALPYKPSDNITDPSCSFGVADCYVTPMAIGETVGGGNAYSVLFLDENGLLGEDNSNLLYDNSFGVLYSDYVTLANNLDITTTTDSTVGNITRDGERILHFYSPGATSAANKNLFLGYQAGNYSLTGATGRNIGIGSNSLDSLTTGITNNALGFNAGTNITIGQSNNFFGGSAGQNLTTGTNNTGMGQAVLYGAGGIGTNTGSYNVAVGDIGMYQITDGTRNSGIGYAVLENVTTGDDNTGVGYAAGNDVGTGSRGTYLGAWSDNDATLADVSDVIALGYGAIARADHQMAVGSDTSYIDDIYFGKGVKSATPVDVTINATGGFGSDIEGADLIIAGGKGTGSATSGSVIFSTANAGSTGSTLQTLTEKMRLSYSGLLSVGNTNSENYNINFSDPIGRMENVITGYGAETQYKARYANGTQASPTSVLNGDALTVFGFSGYDSTDGFTGDVDGGIKFVATEDWSSTSHGNKAIFAVKANGSDTLTKIMSLDSIGLNVGAFGSHTYTLDVNGDANLSSGSVYRINGTQIAASNLSNGTTGSGSVVLAAGSPVITGSLSLTTATGGIFAVGATAGGTYRTKNTDAATLSTPQVLFDVDTTTGTTAGMQSFAFDTTNGFVLTQGNGTRRVARAGINIVSTSDTASAESGDLAFYTKPASNNAMSERLRIDTAGKVGIGDTSPDYLLDVENTGSDTDIFALTDSDGSCLHNPEAGSEVVTCSSDERLKENIVDADSSLDEFMQFKIREYDVIASGDHMTGVIAQEVQEIFPHLVSEGANGFLMVSSPSTWNIIKAIQELKINIDLISSLDTEESGSLGSLIKSFLSDAGNTIEVIFAKVIKTEKIETDELCVGSVCVSEDEFIQIFGNQVSDEPVDNSNNGSDADDTELPSENGDGEGVVDPEDEISPEGEGEIGDETPPEEPEITEETPDSGEEDLPLQ